MFKIQGKPIDVAKNALSSRRIHRVQIVDRFWFKYKLIAHCHVIPSRLNSIFCVKRGGAGLGQVCVVLAREDYRSNLECRLRWLSFIQLPVVLASVMSHSIARLPPKIDRPFLHSQFNIPNSLGSVPPSQGRLFGISSQSIPNRIFSLQHSQLSIHSSSLNSGLVIWQSRKICSIRPLPDSSNSRQSSIAS